MRLGRFSLWHAIGAGLRGLGALSGRRASVYATLLFTGIGALTSLAAGQDFGPDLVNYHRYVGDALLHGSNAGDLYVAALQGFFNPLPYVPFIFLFEVVPPPVAGALVGALHGLIGLAAYLLTLTLLRGVDRGSDRFLAISAGLLAFLSPFVLGTLGGSFSDTPQAILILFGLALLFACLRRMKSEPLRAWLVVGLFVAGALIGLSAGVKVSHFFFATAAIPTILIAAIRLGTKKGIAAVIGFGGGGLAGLIAINYWWFSKSYEDTGSPVYPYIQSLFPSNAVTELGPTSGLDNFPAWAAVKSLQEFFVAPLNWARGVPPPTEWQFTDNRLLLFWAVAVVVIAGLLALWIISRISRRGRLWWNGAAAGTRNGVWIEGVWLLAAYFLAAYLPWIFLLGSIRYAIGIFAIAGIFLMLAIAALPRRPWVQVAATCLLLGVVFLGMKPVYFGRVDWDSSWARTEFAERLSKEPALYIMNADSFWVPSFAEQSVFIRLGELFRGGDYLGRAVSEIDAYKGQIRVMLGSPYGGYINMRQPIYKFLDERGLAVDFTTCERYADYYSFSVCDVVEKSGHTARVASLQTPFNKVLPPQIEAITNISGEYPFGRQTLDADANLVFADGTLNGMDVALNTSSNTPVVSPAYLEYSIDGRSYGRWQSVHPETIIVPVGAAGGKTLDLRDNRKCLPDGYLGSTQAAYPRINLFNLEIGPQLSAAPVSEERTVEFLPDLGTLVSSAVPDAAEAANATLSGFDRVESKGGITAFVALPGQPLSLKGTFTPGAYRMKLSVASPAPQRPTQEIKIAVEGASWPLDVYSCFATYSVPFSVDAEPKEAVNVQLSGIDYPMAIAKIEIFKVQAADRESVFATAPSARSQDIGYVNFGYPTTEAIWLEADQGAVLLPVWPGADGFVLIKGGVNTVERSSPLLVSIGSRSYSLLPTNGSFSALLPVDPASPMPVVTLAIEEPDPAKQGQSAGRLFVSAVGAQPAIDPGAEVAFDLTKPEESGPATFGVVGLSAPDATGRWVDSLTTEIYVPMNLPEDFDLDLVGLTQGAAANGPISVAVGNVQLPLQLSTGSATHRLEFRGVANAGNRITLTLQAPPSGASGSERQDGVSLSKLMVKPLQTVQP